MELTLENCDISMLRDETRYLLCIMLNPLKGILSDDGYRMDWRGLARFCEFPSYLNSSISIESNPTEWVLKEWFKKEKKRATCKLLLDYIEKLDRTDVVDTIEPMIKEDLKFYQNHPQDVETVALYDPKIIKNILTIDDLNRYNKGLEPQIYNAVILFADEDVDFATQLIEKMENLYGLRIFVKERDSLPGTVENQAIIRLIAERCHRVVPILSPAFLQSEANKSFYKIAEAIAISQGSLAVRIIPCIYKDCGVLPPDFQCYCKLNFGSCVAQKLDMWAKLKDCLIIPNREKSAEKKILPQTQTSSELNNVVVTEEEKVETPIAVSAIDDGAPKSSENRENNAKKEQSASFLKKKFNSLIPPILKNRKSSSSSSSSASVKTANNNSSKDKKEKFSFKKLRKKSAPVLVEA